MKASLKFSVYFLTAYVMGIMQPAYLFIPILCL